MKIEISIKNVEILNGQRFEGTPWNSQMQVIHTDKGLFIDNVVGKCFKTSDRSSISWEGIDWKQYIGKTVEILVVDCMGKRKTTINYRLPENIEKLTRELDNHPYKCPHHNWAYPLFLLGNP